MEMMMATHANLLQLEKVILSTTNELPTISLSPKMLTVL